MDKGFIYLSFTNVWHQSQSFDSAILDIYITFDLGFATWYSNKSVRQRIHIYATSNSINYFALLTLFIEINTLLLQINFGYYDTTKKTKKRNIWPRQFSFPHLMR